MLLAASLLATSSSHPAGLAVYLPGNRDRK